MHIQQLIRRLEQYWAKQGCVLLEPYCQEVGAGTFHPATFFAALDEAPWRTGDVQPSRRPADGRYAENPLRAQFYYQYQVLIQPTIPDIQSKYLRSLEMLGVDLTLHDVRFVEDDWESPTLGAWGVGWEVWLDSMEVTQFTYFQQVGGISLDVVPVEITYGIERIAMFLQETYDLYELTWTEGVTYGDLHRRSEIENCTHNFSLADISVHRDWFDQAEVEARRLLDARLALPAYDHVLRMSHAFNMLDARGAISAVERPAFVGRVRALAKSCAEVYLNPQQVEALSGEPS